MARQVSTPPEKGGQYPARDAPLRSAHEQEHIIAIFLQGCRQASGPAYYNLADDDDDDEPDDPSTAIEFCDVFEHGWNQLYFTKQQPMQPADITYTTAITACSKSQQWEGAVHSLAESQQQSAQPDVSAISAGGNSQQWEQGVQPENITYNSAIIACGKSQQWEGAVQDLSDSNVFAGSTAASSVEMPEPLSRTRDEARTADVETFCMEAPEASLPEVTPELQAAFIKPLDDPQGLHNLKAPILSSTFEASLQGAPCQSALHKLEASLTPDFAYMQSLEQHRLENLGKLAAAQVHLSATLELQASIADQFQQAKHELRVAQQALFGCKAKGWEWSTLVKRPLPPTFMETLPVLLCQHREWTTSGWQFCCSAKVDQLIEVFVALG